jgi:hypothetical protein
MKLNIVVATILIAGSQGLGVHIDISHDGDVGLDFEVPVNHPNAPYNKKSQQEAKDDYILKLPHGDHQGYPSV